MNRARPRRGIDGARPVAAGGWLPAFRWWTAAMLGVLALHLATPARAECNPEDAFAAVKQAVETTLACQPVCAESKYKCYGAAGLAIVLTEISRRNPEGQGKVDSFCSSIQGLLGQIKDNAEAVKKIMELLEQLELTSQQSQNVSSILAAVGDAMAVMNCACKTEQLQLKNESSFGACLNDALAEIGCGEIDFSTATIGVCDPVGGFVSDLVNEGLDWLVELGCGLAWDCATGSAGPLGDCIAFGTMHDEQGKCHYCEEFGPHVIAQADGRCGCEAPYSGVWHGRDLIKMGGEYCSCKPPNRRVDGYCLCPSGSQMKNGDCQPCSERERYVPFQYAGGVAQMPSCQQCPIGTKASADHLSCVPMCDNSVGEVLDQKTSMCVACPQNAKAVYVSGSIGFCEACETGQTASANHTSCVAACPPGQVVDGSMSGGDQQADTGSPQCVKCTENTYASYEKAGSSRGTCLPCADGTHAFPGSTECKALTCGPGSYQDPDDPHACKTCPPTQIYIPTEKKIVTGPDGKPGAQIVPGHCGCGENQVLKGGACACATDAVKISIPQAGNGLFACACPEGSQFDAKKSACLCPSGESLQNGKCVSRTQKAVPMKRCRKDEVRNSKGVCVKRIETPKTKTKPKPTKPAPQEQQSVPPPRLEPPAKRLICPPGFVPGPLGKRCIRIVPKDLTTPKLRTPPPLVCPRGKVPDETGKRCVPAR